MHPGASALSGSSDGRLRPDVGQGPDLKPRGKGKGVRASKRAQEKCARAQDQEERERTEKGLFCKAYSFLHCHVRQMI